MTVTWPIGHTQASNQRATGSKARAVGYRRDQKASWSSPPPRPL
ncbi:hypothetical protein J2776_001175 [Paraburkholderia caledonica]|uniref:Uncharacterized protein n=1 Tax=Paraburkholderia caledonica TaxID=134536 RepID=A0ABU1KU78_9BURK|nr:hypothetical protein [Paraburkholderia caledonica]